MVVVILAGTGTLSTTTDLRRQLKTESAESTEFWAEYTIKLVWANPKVKAKSPFGFVPDVESERQKYGELDDVAFAERYQSEYPEVDFATINDEIEKTMQRLGLEHRQARNEAWVAGGLIGFGLWLIPLALVCGFAHGVRWVWRGYKN